MINWYEIDLELKNDPPAPQGKPWQVTRYRAHWYWGTRIGPVYGANFRWYWQANAVSWFWHHVLGWACNTWIYKGALISTCSPKSVCDGN